jgi:hypothetical protein
MQRDTVKRDAVKRDAVVRDAVDLVPSCRRRGGTEGDGVVGANLAKLLPDQLQHTVRILENVPVFNSQH